MKLLYAFFFLLFLQTGAARAQISVGFDTGSFIISPNPADLNGSANFNFTVHNYGSSWSGDSLYIYYQANNIFPAELYTPGLDSMVPNDSQFFSIPFPITTNNNFSVGNEDIVIWPIVKHLGSPVSTVHDSAHCLLLVVYAAGISGASPRSLQVLYTSRSLQLSLPDTGPYLAELTDLNGRRIWLRNSDFNALPWAVLPAGIYLLHISDSHSLTHTFKLIKTN